MIGWDQIVFRIVAGAVLGGLVGLEREVRGQAAGFRTHTLVALGSTLFTLVSIYGFEAFFTGTAGEPYRFDPSRVAAQIVVGIGFLGAGAIMRHGTSVKGLTTAASLWVVAAMGLAAGTGFWVGAITVSLLLLLVLRGLKPTEHLIVRWVYPERGRPYHQPRLANRGQHALHTGTGRRKDTRARAQQRQGKRKRYHPEPGRAPGPARERAGSSRGHQ